MPSVTPLRNGAMTLNSHMWENLIYLLLCSLAMAQAAP
jgi:hypothetical protein